MMHNALNVNQQCMLDMSCYRAVVEECVANDYRLDSFGKRTLSPLKIASQVSKKIKKKLIKTTFLHRNT